MAGSRQKRLTEFDPRREVAIDRRRLPHWRQLGVSYFVTFRLADSLPLDPLRQWRQDRNVWLKWHPPPLTKSELEEYEQRFSSRIQEWLDAGMGACYLRRSDIRSVVESCLLRFDGTRYGIYAFVIMPNHVHALITPHDGYDLSNVLKAIKGVSANRCNKLLGEKAISGWMNRMTTSFAIMQNCKSFVTTSRIILRRRA